MSESGAGAGRREVAWRLFAAEYDDASYSYSQSDEERAPNYVVTPTGARVNRLFVVGVLTEVESVSEEVLRARVVDPTGPFVVYAGQYQPEALAFLERAEPPTFVAVTGKARTFQPDDADVVYTSVRPETINEVDAATRDRWVVATAEQTLDRITHFAAALNRVERGDDLEDALLADGVDIGLAAGVPRAIEQYGTTPAYLDALRTTALDAVRLVADEGDEVATLDLAPDESGDVDLDASFSILDDGVSVVSDEGGTVGEAEPAASDAADESSDAEETTTADSAEPVEATASASTGSESGAGGGDPSSAEPGTDESGSATDESEPDAESVPDSDGDESDAGVDEADGADEPTAADEADQPDAEVAADVGDEMYEMDDEERERVEEEHGLEFSTGTEVESPEESGVEDGEETGDAESGSDADESSEPEPEPAAEPTGADGTGDAEPADLDADDLEDVVVETMQDLDDGDGAAVEELVAAVADEYGVAGDEVRDAIQSALMAGRCFEPDDEHVKPI